MKDRFDLEQEVMRCWEITDDLQHLLEHLDKGIFDSLSPTDTDDLANIVMGLKNVYNMRFQSLFDTLGECISELKPSSPIPKELGESNRLNDVSPEEWDRASKKYYLHTK